MQAASERPSTTAGAGATARSAAAKLAIEAARNGLSEAVSRLIDATDADGRAAAAADALLAALKSGEAGAAQACLDRGAGVRQEHLFAGLQGGVGAPVVKRLLECGASPVRRDGDGQTALHRAARAGSGAKVLEALLEATGRPEAALGERDRWGRTPLHWASDNGHRTSVAALLLHGAAVHAADSQGETPRAIAERRAQCRALRPFGLRPSVWGDIAKQMGGRSR